MDVQSGESDEEEVMGEGIGESEMEELAPTRMRLTKRQRELIPETSIILSIVRKEAISYF